MLVDLEVFYIGHLKNFYTIQYNTIQSPWGRCKYQAYIIISAVHVFRRLTFNGQVTTEGPLARVAD